MKRWATMAILGMLVSLGCVRAQAYVGLEVSYTGLTAPPQYGLPVLPEVQVGGLSAPEFGSVELRAHIGTLLLFSNIGFDALVPFPTPRCVFTWGVARTFLF